MNYLAVFILFVLAMVVKCAPETDHQKEWEQEHWAIESLPDRGGRQFGGLGDLGKVVDSVGKFDLREVSKFLKEIPELFESVNTIVDGADASFGEGADAS